MRPRRPQYRAAATARRSPSAMRALLPLLSVVRGWRVGAAARPPRRVMSLYRTEERGHPHSEDYRLFFSKWLAEFRAGPRSGRAAVLCPAGSAARAQPGVTGDRCRHAARTRRAARGQPPSAATAGGPRRRAPPADLRSVARCPPAPPSREQRSPSPCGRTQNFGDRGFTPKLEFASRSDCERLRIWREEAGGECEPATAIGLCADAVVDPVIL